MRLIVALGARPNVVKVGPLLPELERAGIVADVAFTGSRELDREANGTGAVSFYGVQMPEPRWFLDIGTGTDAVQTGAAIVAFERLFAAERPDAVMVVGDVNPTLAAAVSAVKAGLPVVHLEAGLRCGDLRIPEEVNRVLISRVAAMHLTPTEQALENLEDEGTEPERIHFVGNMMAESVMRHLGGLSDHAACEEFGFAPASYVLGSFHRPENLRDPQRLKALVDGLARSPLPVLLPDTAGLRARLESSGIELPASTMFVEAVPYSSMLTLIRDAAAVFTDSAGVQEEACTICTPCVTMRACTEHGATVEAGANRLVDATPEDIRSGLVDAVARRSSWVLPKRWDATVSDRIVRALRRGVMPLR